MINISVKKSKRLETMMTNTTWLMKFYRIFAQKFLKLWSKEAGSEREWVKTGGARTGNFGFIKLRPHPTKLTVRSGNLIRAAMGGSGAYENITVSQSGFAVTKGISASVIPYAARQEFQLGGQRAYMRPSGQYVMSNSGEKILEQSLNEALK